ELGLRMTAEDFAFYSHHRPVCFFRLGTSKPDQKAAPAVHHPQFDIDENALEVGVKCLVAIALS
ncbi:MAG: M20/M25/M40 family metallo-hydrolase, partial [Flavobacteriia bacterium]